MPNFRPEYTHQWLKHYPLSVCCTNQYNLCEGVILRGGRRQTSTVTQFFFYSEMNSRQSFQVMQLRIYTKTSI